MFFEKLADRSNLRMEGANKNDKGPKQLTNHKELLTFACIVIGLFK